MNSGGDAPGVPDLRFTMGLLIDVLDVLEKHGYPKLSSAQMTELQLALFRLLYPEKLTDPNPA